MRTLTRKVDVTSFKAIIFDSERKETFTEYREVIGKRTERGLVIMMHKGLSPPYSLLKVTDIETKYYVFTMTDEEFIKYAQRKEIKPS